MQPIKMSRAFQARAHWLSALILFLSLAIVGYAQAGVDLREVKWESGDQKLVVKGRDAGRYAKVTVSNADTGAVLDVFKANKEGKFEKKIRDLALAPCRIVAEANGESDDTNVRNAPADCDQGQGGGDDGGADRAAEHQDLVYTGPGTCLECHTNQAHDVFASTHYQWKGEPLYMTNDNGEVQGKHAGAVNTYCGNILGNWTGCSTCHIGLGAEPASTDAPPEPEQLEQIDCLICHQAAYKRKKVDGIMVPDTANMTVTMDEAVRTVHKPTRATCLQCHAKAGGGDALKRGDLALASANTTDKHYDVHMAITGANLSCQDCHKPENHLFPGKGSDLRPTDLDVPVECANSGCHSPSPHEDKDLNRHIARTACQTCHIPVYAKDASDSTASEATEIHRSWKAGTHHTSPPYHPVLTTKNDIIPEYRHWDGYSNNYLLFDPIYPNPETDTYQTSVPLGGVGDPQSKLYPFKYKTSDYPLRTASSQLIALSTSVFFATAHQKGGVEDAVQDGLDNMRLDAKGRGSEFDRMDDYMWVTTDTYQLLNHQVAPEGDALECTDCHLNTAQMDLQGELGYAPSKPPATCSTDCHKAEKAWEWSYGDLGEFKEHHKKHVREENLDCKECHGFSRD